MSFSRRHIGPREHDLKEMLKEVKSSSLDTLMYETIPPAIGLQKPLAISEAEGEHKFLQNIKQITAKNKVFKSYLGLGYYNCIVPGIIQRNILENPGWYTQYTPYQAEISQGRLEALLNFQTMVCDLTKMDIANASLLDEATAAAEAMSMLYEVKNKGVQKEADTFIVSDQCLPQTIDVLKTRAGAIGIKLIISDIEDTSFNDNIFGILLQYPCQDGNIKNYTGIIKKAHTAGVLVVVAADVLSLCLLTPPGEMDADVVVGSTQRLGVPMGYGGPHAAYFTTKDEYKRLIPGRIIGVSVDRYENNALRMALQTREQHIRREKATSNICTAQALLAIMSSMYAVYHGPDGIKQIAGKVHQRACALENGLKALGYKQINEYFFDTLKIDVGKQKDNIKKLTEKAGFNIRYFEDGHIGISLDETTTDDDLKNILHVFSQTAGGNGKLNIANDSTRLPKALNRKSDYLTHEVFNSYQSETEILRYIKRLENKDLSLTSSMIPLGSCTMKLNATSEMIPLSWPEIGNIHPFAPVEQVQGYQEIIRELEDDLCKITGFDGCSLQPNSGAQGEFTGLLLIKAYLQDKGEDKRNICLIPSSAHGTNPASAVMAGMQVVVVNCDENGNIDMNDLKTKAQQQSNNLAALMVTYPSTHGVFEETIQEVCNIIHQNGGQVYMDGANMNAQVGLTSPAAIGADVCHLNLHKTFAIPHGGGGPGVGPICVAKHLTPYLPGHPVIKTGGEKAISAIAAAPWGSASILLISYAYIKLLGIEGITEATKYAILNANYIKSKLEKHYPVLYFGKNGRVAHELIIDCRDFKNKFNIEVEDIAKRLIDYGFHAPTVSFPVPGTLMIEPTESESKKELDRFCKAMIAIRQEIKEIQDGIADKEDNVLKNAPHTATEIAGANWQHPYSREKAVFPIPNIKENKFWPPVGRVDNSYGDRNLVCTCPPVEAYEKDTAEKAE